MINILKIYLFCTDIYKFESKSQETHIFSFEMKESNERKVLFTEKLEENWGRTSRSRPKNK